MGACMEARSSSPWECIVAEVAAPFVQRLSIFLAQSRYDSNQLDCVEIDPKNISGVNAYGARLLSSVKAWAACHETDCYRGAFVDACNRHCSITKGIALED